jgi:hypothetical protein|tara:strand:- start:311 stop:526 length:216 start_codon:yes stop_codon:yes gene_type:complete
MVKIAEDTKARNLDEWKAKFGEDGTQESTAELAAKFMFAMSHYYGRMRLHIMLHPLFFLTGFLTAYFLLGE